MNQTQVELQRKRAMFASSAVAKMLKANMVGEVMVARIFSFFGDSEERLKEALRTDPYLLVDVTGVSLKRADAIAAALGWDLEKLTPLRNQAAVKLVLQANTNFGNTYLPFGVLVREAKKAKIKKVDVAMAVQSLIVAGSVVVDAGRRGKDDFIYLRPYYEAEVSVASLLCERLELWAENDESDADE